MDEEEKRAVEQKLQAARDTNKDLSKKTKFEGTLVGRDAEFVTINLKGRLQKIPIELVEAVRLPTAQTEAGDPYN